VWLVNKVIRMLYWRSTYPRFSSHALYNRIRPPESHSCTSKSLSPSSIIRYRWKLGSKQAHHALVPAALVAVSLSNCRDQQHPMSHWPRKHLSFLPRSYNFMARCKSIYY